MLTHLLLSSLSLAAAPQQETAVDVVGHRAVDLDGTVHQLGLDHAGGTGLDPMVFVFLDPGCPISCKLVPRLNELGAEARAAGLPFFGVMSDPSLSTREAREHRDAYALEFPVLFDVNGELAARLAPTHVPEAFVVSKDESVLYRGRVDDRFEAPGKQRAQIRSHDLADAMARVLDGSAEVARTTPVGCVFEAWDEADEDVTYHREIEPILRANCVSCHRPGDIGPFLLEDYADARRRSKMIALVTEDRTMPPWHAVPGIGSFRDEHTLGEREIQALATWARTGAKEGDPDMRLPNPANERTSAWRLGEPDYVVEMPVDFEIPAQGEDVYRYFVIPSELLRDEAIVAVDFRPGDPSVVHHAILYQDFSGWGREMDAAVDGPGFGVFGEYEDAGDLDDKMMEMVTVTGWAPGAEARRYSPGLGQLLEAGGDFLLEIHYHLSGKRTSDRSQVGLYFAKQPVERYVESLVIGTEDIDIPAGESQYRRRVWMKVPTDLELIDLSPHMHYLGTNVEVNLTRPDGTVEPLLAIDGWDFRWQGSYVYREPVRLPKGSRIDATFLFDNSEANPANPSAPPIRVAEGWQTTDEMCLLYLTVVPDDPRQMEAVYWAMFASFFRPGDF